MFKWRLGNDSFRAEDAVAKTQRLERLGVFLEQEVDGPACGEEL